MLEIYEVATLVHGALLCILPPQWCRTMNMCCERRVRSSSILLELTHIHWSSIYKMHCSTIVCLSVYLFAVIHCFQWLQSAVDRNLLPSPHQPNFCLLKKPALGHYSYPARWNKSTLKLVSADICVLLCGKFFIEREGLWSVGVRVYLFFYNVLSWHTHWTCKKLQISAPSQTEERCVFVRCLDTTFYIIFDVLDLLDCNLIQF